jgi:hypothetical protein
MGRVNPAVGAVLAIYWLTPVFAAIDFIYGQRLRVAFFDDNVLLRVGYYVLMMVLGLAMTRWPTTIRHLAPIESGVNVALTAMGLMMVYTQLADDVEAGRPTEINMPFIPLLISIGVMILSHLTRHIQAHSAK